MTETLSTILPVYIVHMHGRKKDKGGLYDVDIVERVLSMKSSYYKLYADEYTSFMLYHT